MKPQKELHTNPKIPHSVRLWFSKNQRQGGEIIRGAIFGVNIESQKQPKERR